jgi:hypothetical protein
VGGALAGASSQAARGLAGIGCDSQTLLCCSLNTGLTPTLGKTAGSPNWHHGHFTLCCVLEPFKSAVLTNLTPACEHTTCMLSLEMMPFLTSNSPASGMRLCSAMSASAAMMAARRRTFFNTTVFYGPLGVCTGALLMSKAHIQKRSLRFKMRC